MSNVYNNNHAESPIIDPYHPRWVKELEHCESTNRLMQKLEEIQKENPEKEIDRYLILKSVFYAKFYHAGQVRKSGEPYYIHPLEVAIMVAEYMFRTDMIVTAILHDTLEDTTLTFEMIEKAFNHKIAQRVQYLTRIDDNDKKISAAQIVEYLLQDKCYDALLIKLLDRMHNLMTIKAKPTASIKKTVEETLHAFLILAAYLGLKNIEKKMAKMCIACQEKGLID